VPLDHRVAGGGVVDLQPARVLPQHAHMNDLPDALVVPGRQRPIHRGVAGAVGQEDHVQLSVDRLRKVGPVERSGELLVRMVPTDA